MFTRPHCDDILFCIAASRNIVRARESHLTVLYEHGGGMAKKHRKIFIHENCVYKSCLIAHHRHTGTMPALSQFIINVYGWYTRE